jgi:hypothetical protein
LGNEGADELAKNGADNPFTEYEPVIGLPYNMVKRAIREWMESKHIECWKSGKDCKHSKALMEELQQGRATKVLNMSRQQLSVFIGLLTEHFGLNGHLCNLERI